MSVYVFLGPTLSVDEARTYLDAVYLPPIEQGDLTRLLRERPRVVGIIDGRFQFVPSVWHKEILAALEQGVHVFGAASMGALRAAELAAFGMTGVGKVFEQYSSGGLEDDDEVAVAHAGAEHGFREASDAMVNIRDACNTAAADGQVSTSIADSFIAIAKDLYFPERNWARVFAAARENGVPEDSIAAMDRFRRQQVPLKRRDAIEMLRRIAAFEDGPKVPFCPAFRLERTVFLSQLQSEVESDRAEVLSGTSPQALKVAQKKVLLELLALQEARRTGAAIDDSAVQDMTSWFRAEYGLLPDDNFRQWTASVGLTSESFRGVMERFAALARVQQNYRTAIDGELPGHLAVMSAQNRKSGWSQWNVKLSRSNGAAAQNAAQLLKSLRHTNPDEQFYFMRKAPDIRLRFRGGNAQFASALQRQLETAQQDGFIESFFPSIYEPEIALFGGGEAMDFVHAYFDADTRVWIGWQTAPPEYSLAVLNDLFTRTLQSSNEVWQTWVQMESVDAVSELPEDLLPWNGELREEHARANVQLAEGLHQAWASGTLTAGIRAILASVAMFHFNRFGIPGPVQAALAGSMARRLRPMSHAQADV